MTETTPPPLPTALPLLCWTWCGTKKGTLATVFKPDGEVQQGRQHPGDDEIFFAKLGRVSQEEFSRLIEAARALPLAENVPTEFPTGQPECVEARLRDSTGERAIRLPVAQLPSQPGLGSFRRLIVGARRSACGGFFAWNSIAGRMTILFAIVVAAMCWWFIKDSRNVDRLEKVGQRLDAEVVEHAGQDGYDRNKFIQVKFDLPGGGAGQAKIAAFLSAENWDAAKVGTTVRIWRDPQSGEAWVENDLLRWQKDKKWAFILPGSIAAVGLLLCAFLSRYRVGVHRDGQEFLTREDMVSADDKDALISRNALNTGRLLYFLTR